MSDSIGVIRDFETKQILAVINPDDDAELDNPRWLLIRAGDARAIELVRVPRDKYMGALTLGQLVALIEGLK
jgi:hypothetical protein